MMGWAGGSRDGGHFLVPKPWIFPEAPASGAQVTAKFRWYAGYKANRPQEQMSLSLSLSCGLLLGAEVTGLILLSSVNATYFAEI